MVESFDDVFLAHPIDFGEVLSSIIIFSDFISLPCASGTGTLIGYHQAGADHLVGL